MESLVGTDIVSFICITVVIMGFAAFMTGKAIAENWRPLWQLIFYVVLLGFGDRFLIFALAEGDLLMISGYVIDTLILMVIALVVHRAFTARQMEKQYPWLYERVGLFGWREKA